MNVTNTLFRFFCLLLLSFVACNDTYIWRVTDILQNKDAGLLEVRKNQGSWMKICKPWTDLKVVNVACRQMGHLGAKDYNLRGVEQTGIISQNFSCPTENEKNITLCTFPPPSSDKCPLVDGSRSLAAEVKCESNGGLLGFLNVELQGGSVHSGTLEYTHNGKKTPVCYDYPNAESIASVVCKQMGYSDKKTVSSVASNATEFASLECSGSEQTLDACTFRNHVSSCAKGLAVAVECKLNITSQKFFDIRLSSPDRSPSQGTVEVWRYGYWGVICHNDWTIEDANVVCSQLGYRKATDAPKNAMYGQGTGVVFWDKVNCTGNEFSIADCPHTTAVVSATCDSTKAAGVSCNTTNPLTSNYICSDGPISIPAGDSFLRLPDSFVYENGTTCSCTSTNLTAATTLTLYIHQKMFQQNHVESLTFYNGSSQIRLYGDDSSAGPFSFTDTDNFTIEFKSDHSQGEGILNIQIKASAPVSFTCNKGQTTTPSVTAPITVHGLTTAFPAPKYVGNSDTGNNAGVAAAVTGVVIVLLVVIPEIILWRLGYIHFGKKTRNSDGNGRYDVSRVANGATTAERAPENYVNVGEAYENIGEPVYMNSAFVADQPANISQGSSDHHTNYENMGDVTFRQEQNSGNTTALAEPEQGSIVDRNHGNGTINSGAEEGESQYAKLEPVQRSEYADLRGLTAEQLKPV